MTSHVHLGDCREYLATLPAESVDSVVTDPPYGLNKDVKITDDFAAQLYTASKNCIHREYPDE